MQISIITPVYKAEAILPELFRRLVVSISQITDDFEIIMVNDGSPGNDWEVIVELAKKDKRVKGINLSRNFGQHYAITAGLDHCSGEWIVVMDCDLQDRPEEIPNLYNKAMEGWDIVVGVRQERKDNFFKKLTSKLFYIVFNYLTDQNLDNRVANFGIYNKKVIDSVKLLGEQARSFGLLVVITGFKRTELGIVHATRESGKSAYSFKKRLDLALDHILSHSTRPLFLTIKTGFLISSLSAIYSLYLMSRYFIYSNIPDGWTSLMVSLFLLSGLIIMFIGIVGVYISKIFTEVKKRPLYFIKDII